MTHPEAPRPVAPAVPGGPAPAAPGLPGPGRLAGLGMLAVLGPAVAVFALLRAVGLGTGAAGLLGLLAGFVGLGCYPVYLRRLSVRFPKPTLPAAAPAAASPPAPAGPPPPPAAGDR